mgnify:FL=1
MWVWWEASALGVAGQALLWAREGRGSKAGGTEKVLLVG